MSSAQNQRLENLLLADTHFNLRKIAGNEKLWREGEVLIFDDSFLHSAHNKSDQTRVVLIFSIWQPDLSADERQAVQKSFKTRQEWLAGRQSQLQKLLFP